MKEVSKILIAYDGSECSDAALNDLRRAGLPPSAEAAVVTAADIILPPADEELPGEPAVRIPEVERHARERAGRAVAEARTFVERAARRVKEDFPGWDIKAEVECDAPAWAVIKMAGRMGADLVVIGSHRHAVAGGRFILGSTSQRVLYEAGCSVRVARCSDERRGGPVRLVVGFNGTRDAEAAVEAAASRAWPEGSEARLVTAGGEASPESVKGAAERLRAAGLGVAELGRAGDAAHALLREAEEWDADCIFVGTRGLHGFQHLLHGSVAAAVAAQARCSVEVARSAKGTA
ncbi:MAG TPA: universal stress protein [Pyrinomonadaceae bacterium]|nr:universal stress protein [Pyrinomonadaceae bacterium]